MTWYEGDVLGGYGGTFGIYDETYHQVGRVAAGNGMHGDLHEFLITSRGTALISIYLQVPADLSSIGGPVAGQLVIGVVQEIDIPTGKVLFQWRSDDHVPLTETNMPQVTAAGNVDYFHLNSIGVDPDGHLLISARHTDRSTRSIARPARSSGGSAARAVTSSSARGRRSITSTTSGATPTAP